MNRKKKRKNIKLLEDLKLPVNQQIKKWKQIKTTLNTNLNEYIQFDCEKFIKLTEMEKCLLHQLKYLEQLQWFEDVRDVNLGECFGQVPLEDLENPKDLLPRTETILVKQNAGLASIRLKDLYQVYMDAEERHLLMKFEFFDSIPLFKEINQRTKK